MSAMLNNKQREAVEFVANGHNLVLIGKAGTGKTCTVKSIVEKCHLMGKKCAVTATTGIACSVYQPSMNAMTIHRWSGIGDGRYGPPEIKNIVANNVKFKKVVERILQTDVLIIDEFSMLSKRTLECLDAVCSIKNPQLYFGGIQIVLVGDLVQLPPVPCARYSEGGEYCFESCIYNKAFPHQIRLIEVYRQSDLQLVKAVEEVSLGVVTDETVSLLKDLSRPLDLNRDDSVPIRLFATNDMVDDYNRDQILNFPGTLSEFLSTDTGEKKYLSEVIASRKLWLKIAIPVILIKNLTDQLVNGLRGTVYDILEDGKVLVEFPNVKEKIYIEKVKFEVFDPRRNTVIASREQIPLKPAFALTIHKSQGMTLDSVQVDCRQIFKAGQLGVAIGRVRSLAGLRVINFTRKACMKQPEKILKLSVEGDSLDTAEDKSCCNGYKRGSAAESFFTVDDLTDIEHMQNDDCQSDYENLEDDFNDIIAAIDREECTDIHLPENLSLKDILDGAKAKIIITPEQYENNEILSRISLSKEEIFAKQQYKKLISLLSECKTLNTGQIVSKDLGNFYTNVHSYLVGSEFTMQCLKLFDTEDRFTKMHQRICTTIFVSIREFIIKMKATEVETTCRQINKRTITHASRARIRYIGGYCIAKVKHKYVIKKATHRYSEKTQDKQEYENAKCAIEILNCLSEEEQIVIASTEEPESLLDISRRQNLNRGLTNISDGVFYFFIKLTEKCLDLLIGDNLNKMGNKMFNECQSILASSDIYTHFVELCCNQKEKDFELEVEDESVKNLLDSMTLQVTMMENIYHKIIKYQLMVMFNQFRKDTLDSLKVAKKMAHRKQVRVSDSSGKSTSSKHVEQKKHKGQSKKGSTGAADSASQSDTPVDLVPQPGTSAEQNVETVITEPASDPACDSEEKCKVCDTIGRESDWIQCDGCKGWLHRTCAGLKHHLRWKKYQKECNNYFCNNCQ